jgi:hypothetical protein
MPATENNLRRFAVKLLCCAAFLAAGALTPAHAAGPQLAVHVVISSEKKPAFSSLRLSVLAPDGRVAWRHDAADGTGLDNITSRGLQADGWHTAPGVYRFVVTYSLADGAKKELREEQEFKVEGKELRVQCLLWFGEAKGQPISLDYFRIARILRGAGGVLLAKNWIPGRGGSPRYTVNSSLKEPIYGAGLRGNFFGRVETEVNGSWVNYPRGGFCGTVDGGQPIPAGGSADSIEGYFLGRAKEFVPGRYRYVLQYTLRRGPAESLFGDDSESPARRRTPEVYEIYDEFYIGG